MLNPSQSICSVSKFYEIHVYIIHVFHISLAKVHPNFPLRSFGCHPGRQFDDLQQCHRRMQLEPSVGTAATLAAGAAVGGFQ